MASLHQQCFLSSGAGSWTLRVRANAGNSRNVDCMDTRAFATEEVRGVRKLWLFLAGVFVLQVCSQFISARLQNKQPHNRVSGQLVDKPMREVACSAFKVMEDLTEPRPELYSTPIWLILPARSGLQKVDDKD